MPIFRCLQPRIPLHTLSLLDPVDQLTDFLTHGFSGLGWACGEERGAEEREGGSRTGTKPGTQWTRAAVEALTRHLPTSGRWRAPRVYIRRATASQVLRCISLHWAVGFGGSWRMNSKSSEHLQGLFSLTL